VLETHFVSNSSEEAPAPRLVAAWMRLDILAAESVPLWAAHWLVAGYDGDTLVELAGLSGRDTRAVRELLPGAFAEMGVEVMSSVQAAAKLAFDDIASLPRKGLAGWLWVVQAVRQAIEQGGYAIEYFDEPLSSVYELDEELSADWDRSQEQLAQAVEEACQAQLDDGHEH
jgi:hypothetical protein